VRPKFK